jgi:predicted acylesterase/phospholipase RssA
MAHEREVRLGIVLYGGVSLAIYENGVAQELFRAVKGEGVYSFIKELIDSDIVVDIMSGTSAGGINGIMLGFALANGRDFKASAKLWREDGDILRLLNDPSASSATSVLDSRGYYQERLQAAFDGMPPYLAPGNDGVSAAKRDVSPVSEIDLFVTGTDVQGRVFTVFDDQGHPIDVKNHSQVFLLSYREDRKNEFKPADSSSLAKLARITSCFPVAFEPVQVDSKDATLRRWGHLDDRENIFFLDGGVLNNKPFTYTIDAIARRTADRDVDRMLFYVEPDPERFQETPLKLTPNIVQAASDALIGIPGYQSIASDLEAIAAHNDHVQQLGDILKANCVPSAESAPDCFGKPNPDGGLDSIPDSARRCMYMASRLGQLRESAVEGILNENGARKLLRGDEVRHAAKILVESFEKWEGVPSDTLAQFDVYFRMRRMLHMSYFIKELLYPNTPTMRNPGDDEKNYRLLWRGLNHQFKLLEEIQYAMELTIGSAIIPWGDLKDKEATSDNAAKKWVMVQNAMTALLDAVPDLGAAVRDSDTDDDTLMRQEREALMGCLRARKKAIAGHDDIARYDISKVPVVSGNLLLHCDELEREILQKFAPGGAAGPAAREYCRFVTVDSCRFPLQRSAGSESLDVIHTVRISPIDAKRGYSSQTLNEKLCGNELGHFGGFMKRSWRANDTMWGRLDAICQLIECLITPERYDQLPADTLARALGYNLDLLFPNSPAAQRDEIREAAKGLPKSLNEPNDGGRARKLRFERFWDALVRAAQAEILNEEVPRVIDAAIRQQADWNQFSLIDPNRKLISQRQVWSVSPRRLDTAVSGYASARLTNETAPKPGAWPIYFDSVYAVGSECWNNDIPKPIMLEIVASAALVMRNCLLVIAGPNGAKIRKSPLYQVGINLPLLLTYKLVRMQRTAPEYFWVTLVSLLAISIGLLLVEFVFRSAIFGADAGQPNIFWWLVPAILVAIILAIVYFFRRPVHAVTNPAKDIRSGLLAAKNSLAKLKDCLILNQAPWRPVYPGTILGDAIAAQPDLPPTLTGPVENFCAVETLPTDLHQATIEGLFNKALSVDRVRDISMRVERLRVIAGRESDMQPGGAPVVAEAYEGTVTLTLNLCERPDKTIEFQLRTELAKTTFRFLSGFEPDDENLRIVSEAPVVFAYRAIRCNATANGVEKYADVLAAELVAAKPAWYQRVLPRRSKTTR